VFDFGASKFFSQFGNGIRVAATGDGLIVRGECPAHGQGILEFVEVEVLRREFFKLLFKQREAGCGPARIDCRLVFPERHLEFDFLAHLGGVEFLARLNASQLSVQRFQFLAKLVEGGIVSACSNCSIKLLQLLPGTVPLLGLGHVELPGDDFFQRPLQVRHWVAVPDNAAFLVHDKRVRNTPDAERGHVGFAGLLVRRLPPPCNPSCRPSS